MPSTGDPTVKSAASHFGAPSSETLLGPPERMIPTGLRAAIAAAGVLNGRISQ